MAKKPPKKATPAAKKKKPAPAKKTAKPAKKQAAKKAKKKTKAKPAAPSALPWRTPLAGETLVGIVDDYFGHISVIAFKLQAPLRVGEKIHVRGHTTDLVETVGSIQAEHKPLTDAKPGDSIGIKTDGKCRAGDYVYRVAG